jgi:hypothetical protein
MDLGLDKPALHEALGLPNENGVSDAFLYGASVQHIARPALDETIFFAPAGTATADPEEVLEHPRWDDLTGGFSEADATLLLFLPTDTPGAADVLKRATDVVFLARENEAADDHLGPAAVKVLAGLGPGSLPSEEPEAPGPAEPVMPETFPGDLELPQEGLLGADEVEEALEFGGREGLELSEDFAGLAPEDALGIPPKELETLESTGAEREEPGPEQPVLDGVGDTASDIPDFGADFAEMPPLEENEPAAAPVSGGVEGLVQGADFGEPATMEVDHALVPARQGEGPEGAGETPSETGPGPGARERPRPTLPPKKIVTRGRVGAVVGVAVVLGVLGLAAFDLVRIPGLSFIQGALVETPEPGLVRAGAESTDPPLYFSVALDSGFGEEDLTSLAVPQLTAWRDRFPDVLFTLVPVRSEEGVTYTVLAGPAVDRVQAEELRVRLAAIRPEEPEAWPIHPTPLGFHLGMRETLPEARSQVADLEADGIFGYILQVSLTDGSEGYDVFAGAYQGMEDAGPLWDKLLQLGLSDAPLIERRGRLPE